METNRRTLASVVGGTLWAGSLLLSGNAAAELIIGLTTQNALISFDSATPSTVSSTGITGLTAGDVLRGIDRRPSLGANDGTLYGFATAGAGVGRLYTINTTTGVATFASTLAPDPADTTAPFPFTTISGTSFGIDFNPTVDRLRVTSNSGQNLRINVDTGFVQLDVPLAYQSGDANFGALPTDVAVAYSNNFGGATTTTLRGVDIGRTGDLLVIHTNPNAGLLQSSLDLGFDSTELIGYDISGLSGTPFFSVTAASAGSSQLYTVSGGAATLLGDYRRRRHNPGYRSARGGAADHRNACA